jgi:hypothetical protein
MPKEFWKVYNYVARNWYEREYGVDTPRWYYHAMVFLEEVRDKSDRQPQARRP